MKRSLGNLLLRNKFRIIFVLNSIFFVTQSFSQIANYVNNPSFEVALPSVTFTPYEAAQFWGALDSTKGGSHRLRAKSINSVPNGFGGYQLPKSGDNFIGTTFYCDMSTCGEVRWYPRNRLKSTLKPNTVYCAKYHVVPTNNSPLGIKEFSAFFGGGWLDTTTHCTKALTYLSPQVGYQGTIISDTLNWTPVTGTFVADGTEKYMVLGNFKSNPATQTVIINPTYLPAYVSDILIDDVSLIEMDLPAFAGNDTAIVPGDSAFIGRTPDVGIDEACQWFKLPNMNTAFDTVAGLWVKPVNTTTYVVRQQLWCSGVKWDTVVVHMNPVGINEKLEQLIEELKVYPVPANDRLALNFRHPELISDFESLSVFNNVGELLREQEIRLKEKTTEINTSDLAEGIYSLRLRSKANGTISKRFVIQR